MMCMVCPLPWMDDGGIVPELRPNIKKIFRDFVWVWVYFGCVNTRQVIRLLKDDGWEIVGQTGSHAHYKHATKVGKVTVPMHGGGKDLKLGTLNSILKQAGLK